MKRTEIIKLLLVTGISAAAATHSRAQDERVSPIAKKDTVTEAAQKRDTTNNKLYQTGINPFNLNYHCNFSFSNYNNRRHSAIFDIAHTGTYTRGGFGSTGSGASS